MHNKRMLDIEDRHTRVCLSSLIKRTFADTGVYENIVSINELIHKCSNSQEIFIKRIPKQSLSLYCIYDIDVGLNNCLSSAYVKCLVDRHLIPVSTKVHLRYIYGNVYAFVLKEDININVLKTDKTYFVVHDSNCIYSVKIGEFTRPNSLYLKDHLDGVTTTLAKALKFNDITSYSVISECDLMIMDIPL